MRSPNTLSKGTAAMSMHSTLEALSDKYDATSIPINEVPITTTRLSYLEEDNKKE